MKRRVAVYHIGIENITAVESMSIIRDHDFGFLIKRICFT